MQGVAGGQQMTAEEFVALPVPERGRPWNLIDGEIVVTEATMVHGDALDAIHAALRAWTVESPGRGRVPWPCDIGLDERNVFVPDVLWYREERVPNSDQPPPYPLPDLVVEVRSPSTWRFDVGRKRAKYEAAGLPELWLVDTVERQVLVHRRSSEAERVFDILEALQEGDELTSPLLPEFSLPVKAVFA